MYLKSIEIYGFKSFANKITFEFKHGITGIVGPNGSGKSNVGDAVRWVLGEQSAKQLRGAKMEDVIFSGTESRKPLGSAYVAITLDNKDHSLPIDYEEVCVARRVYRSGESEYLINGSSCRLKDVHELFFDTGIGKEGYSIIGQGQIDKILSGKPEDRRELFDEAAGIVKYKKNKAATEKALDGEKQNLYRVNDILSEIETQVEPLKLQSIAAKNYLLLKEEQKDLDINVFLLENKHMKDSLNNIEQKINISSQETKSIQEEYDKTKEEYDKLELQIESVNQQIDKTKTGINEIKLLKEKLEGEVKVLKEQIKTARMNEEHNKNRMMQIRAELEIKEKEKQEFFSNQDVLDVELGELNIQKEDMSNKLIEKQEQIQELFKAIELGKSGIIEAMNESASIKNKMQRYDTMLEQILLRKAELTQRLLKNKSEENDHVNQYADLKVVHKHLEVTMTSLQNNIKEKEDQLAQNHLASRNNLELLNHTQQEFHRSRSKMDTLKNMTERYEGYGNSIKRVMEKKAEIPGVIGVVADIIKVKKQYEIAVETALGGSIQNVVTDNESTAKQLIQHLKQNKYGRATFLPLTSITNKNSFYNEKALTEPGVIGLASELVETNPRFLPLTEHLLGRIVVVDHIDHAIALAQKYKYSMRIVTTEGESFSPGGAMTGGAFKNNSNLLGRRRELAELEQSIVDITNNIETKKQLELELNTDRQKIKDVLKVYLEQREEYNLAHNTNCIRLTQMETKLEELAISFKSLQKENKELDNQVVEINISKSQLNVGNEEQEQVKTDHESTIAALEEKLSRQRQEEMILQDQVSDMKLKFSTLKQQNDFHMINIKRIKGEENKLNQEIIGFAAHTGDIEKEVLELESKIQTITLTIDTQKDTIEIEDRNLTAYEAEKNQITSTHKNFFHKREELSNRLNGLDKESFRLQTQKEKNLELINELEQYMWEEYELTFNNALSMKNQEYDDLSQLKKDLSTIKNKIKALGVVNVNSIEDSKNLTERYEFLKEQRDDLLKAEENLKQIIKELDIAMRDQFNEKFGEIQQMFHVVFQELFGGGKASLELMEGEDVLEAGVRIVAQPPGKKLQNMMQLSGGEKALTAIALLFAIQNLKPSPFCLLDEIEAALDDSNVKRYAQYLHKLTKDTQFIVITHRRGTMTAADVLYGITMQEKGISTLVSVSLIENELDK